MSNGCSLLWNGGDFYDKRLLPSYCLASDAQSSIYVFIFRMEIYNLINGFYDCILPLTNN